jgi:hypothetical protein
MLGLVSGLDRAVDFGQETSNHGDSYHSLVKGATIPRKGLFLYINKLLYSSLYKYCNACCCVKKKNIPLYAG